MSARASISEYDSPVLFFYSYGDHRDLHSFPTRRSSDLRPTARVTRRAGETIAPAGPAAAWPASPASSRQSRRETACRSEEHTSELQSRLHLVCRLLLEKKKK